MTLAARLHAGETLGDRIIKVDHAGEHGAVCVYLAQRWIAQWRTPDLVPEIDDFIAHERRHRALFGAALAERGRPRCRSYWLCGFGGYALGGITALFGRHAIAATTVAIEAVVLRHLDAQLTVLSLDDRAACDIIGAIIDDEKTHHAQSVDRLGKPGFWTKLLLPIVGGATEVVIWLGMKL